MKRQHALIFFSIKLIISLMDASAIPRTLVPAHINTVAAIRGGAGPLNVKDTAKVAALVFGAQGAFGALAPAKANEAFGLPSNALDDFHMKRSSVLILSLVLLVWELVFKKTGVTKAVGISAVPVVVEILQPLLNGDFNKLGFAINQQYFLLAFWFLVAYTSLSGSKYADAMVKASAIANVGSGVFTYFFPAESLVVFGSPTQSASTASKVQMRAMAVLALAEGMIVFCLLWGSEVDPIKAVGYGWIPFALHIINGLLVNKEFVELGLNKFVLTFWLVFHLVVATTLAF